DAGVVRVCCQCARSRTPGLGRITLLAPQGVYPCAGKDRWVAIDAAAQDQWTSLRNLIGGALGDTRFDTIVGRLRNREDLDRAIAQWTHLRESDAVEAELQAVRIPAHVVSRGLDLERDADLRHVGHFVKIDDPAIGEVEIEGPRAAFDRTPAAPTRRGPRIGEHTHEILREVCAMSEQEIVCLSADGILQ